MYTQKEYMEKAEEANRKNQQLYIFGTGEPNEDGTFDGKLIIIFAKAELTLRTASPIPSTSLLRKRKRLTHYARNVKRYASPL